MYDCFNTIEEVRESVDYSFNQFPDGNLQLLADFLAQMHTPKGTINQIIWVAQKELSVINERAIGEVTKADLLCLCVQAFYNENRNIFLFNCAYRSEAFSKEAWSELVDVIELVWDIHVENSKMADQSAWQHQREYDRLTFDALTDGQMGDFDDFQGDMDDVKDYMGH
jgi:hypothetical protein